MTDNSTSRLTTGKIVDVALPVLLLALLIALCIQLLIPFVGLLLWTIVLAICFYPLHSKLLKRGWSPRRSATVIGVFLAAFILVPTAIAATSAASAIPGLVETVQSGEKHLPPPPAKLKELPLVGPKADALWTQASSDWPAFR